MTPPGSANSSTPVQVTCRRRSRLSSSPPPRPLTNLHAGDSRAGDLPLAIPRTRRAPSEAGSYGRDTRGLIRITSLEGRAGAHRRRRAPREGWGAGRPRRGLAGLGWLPVVSCRGRRLRSRDHLRLDVCLPPGAYGEIASSSTSARSGARPDPTKAKDCSLASPHAQRRPCRSFARLCARSRTAGERLGPHPEVARPLRRIRALEPLTARA